MKLRLRQSFRLPGDADSTLYGVTIEWSLADPYDADNVDGAEGGIDDDGNIMEGD